MLGTWVDNVTAILEADEFKPLLNSGLRGRPPTIVSESGLYALVLKSRKPEAKAFRKWVTSEVLPSIRRHGVYMTKEVAVMATESPAVFLARALTKASESGKSKGGLGRLPKYVFYENSGE